MFAWKQGVYKSKKTFIVPVGQPIRTCKPPRYSYILSSLRARLVCTEPFPCAHDAGNRQQIPRRAPSLAELTCCDSPLWCDRSHVQTQPKERTGLCPLTALRLVLTWLVKCFRQQTQLLADTLSGALHHAGFSGQFLCSAESTCITRRKKRGASYCLSFIATDTYFSFITAKSAVSHWDPRCNICPEKGL